MSGTDQNPYPSCIKCNAEISPQDSRGWETIEIKNTELNVLSPKTEIWLCPNCISKFEYVQDTADNYEKQIFEYQEFFAGLNKLLKDNQGVG